MDVGMAVIYVLVIIVVYTIVLAVGGYIYVVDSKKRQKLKVAEAKEEKLLAEKTKVMEQAGKVAASKNTAKEGAEFMRKSVLIRSSAGADQVKDLTRKKSFFEEVAEVGR